MAVELRDIDLALASYPEGEWADAGRARAARARCATGSASTADEAYAAMRRASYLAAAAGDPESGDDPDGPAVLAIAEELHTRERALALFDAVRGELAPRDGGAPPARRARAARARGAAGRRSAPAPGGCFCAALYAAELADDDDDRDAAEDAP